MVEQDLARTWDTKAPAPVVCTKTLRWTRKVSSVKHERAAQFECYLLMTRSHHRYIETIERDNRWYRRLDPIIPTTNLSSLYQPPVQLGWVFVFFRNPDLQTWHRQIPAVCFDGVLQTNEKTSREDSTTEASWTSQNQVGQDQLREYPPRPRKPPR